MYDYKSDNKQSSAENEMGTFERLGNISSDFKLKRGDLPQWAVNWARNKFDMDVKNVKFYITDEPKANGFVALAGGSSIFVDPSHKNDGEVIKHELTHIYQQAVGSAQKSNADDPELEREAIEVSNGKNPDVSKNSKLGKGFVIPKENTGVVQGFSGSTVKTDVKDEIVVISPSNGTVLTSDDTSEYQDCKKIKIDESVTEIGPFAFDGFDNLSNIDMSNVRKIGEGAFWGCQKLNNVEIPNVVEIGIRAFRECRSLSNIYMPNVTRLGEEAFRACPNLINVDMPNVIEIDKNAFWICQRLNSIHIPNIKKIVSGAFATCIQLSSIEMQSVTEIDEGAFSGCGVLSDVKIPNVAEIGELAFIGCKSLKKVTVPYYCNYSKSAFPDGCQVELENIPAASNIDKLKLMKLYEIGRVKPGDFLKDIDVNNIDFAKESNCYLLIDALYNKSVRLADVISKFNINPENFLTKDKYGFDIYDAYIKNWVSEDEMKRLMPDINLFSKMNTGADAEYYSDVEVGLTSEFQKRLPDFEKFSKTPGTIITEFVKNYRYNSLLWNGMRSGIYQYADNNVSENQVLTELMPYMRNTGEAKIELYRGVRGYETIDCMANMPIGSFEKNAQCIVGKEIFDRSFISTTIIKNIAIKYSDYRNFEDRENNKKDAVILEIKVPEGRKLNMMPIANSQNEVVLNKFQKLKVNRVTNEGDMRIIECEAIEDKDNLYKTEKDIYESNEFKKYQEEFEIDLGRYLYKSDEAYKAVHEGIRLIKEKNSESGRSLREIFYSNKKSEVLLRDQKTTDEELQSSGTAVAGNLKENLAAFQFVVDDGKLGKIDSNNQESNEVEPHIERRKRTDEEKEKFRNGEITYGGMSFQPQYNGKDIDFFYGKRLVAGTSETAKRLLSKYREVNKNKADILNFRLALMACMLPEKDHSLYEILQASHEVGVRGYENLSTADTMDKTIDPLGKEKVEKEVCKDKGFPFERTLKEKKEGKP